MRNKCLLGLGLVFVISLTSMVAFAFSFTGTPADEVDETEIIVSAVVSEEADAMPTTEPITTTGQEMVKNEQSKIGSMDWDSDDAYRLAKIAMAEAESEDTEGKALVMLVVLNRVWDDEFPDTIEEVIFQKGQFSPIGNGRYDEVEPDEDCYRALQLIQTDGWDESHGATYFESKSDSTWHSENLTFLFKHMKKCKLLLLDLDGTLLQSDKTISTRTLSALKKCRENDILIGVSTSRSEQNSLVFLNELMPDILISSGGALVKYKTETINLYWEIGEEIYRQQEENGWGKSIVQVLSTELQKEFPGAKGYSAANLWRMRNFYLTYRDSEKLAPLVREISWSNNIIIMEKCKDDLQREFYIQMVKRYGWTKRILTNFIEAQTYEKYLLNQTNFDLTLPVEQSVKAKLAVKDEYTFF